MKNILTWLKGLFSGVVKIADRTAETIAAVSKYALPWVTEVANLTDNTKDDRLVALYNRYGIPNVEKYLALPEDSRGEALMNAVMFLVKPKFSAVGSSLLRAGIELALQAYKDRIVR